MNYADNSLVSAKLSGHNYTRGRRIVAGSHSHVRGQRQGMVLETLQSAEIGTEQI